MLRITGGKIFDPASGINGEVRDLCVDGGRFVSSVDGGRTIDASGMIIFPGGVDVHTHVAGGSINFARAMTPEDHRRTTAFIRGQSRRSGLGGMAPTTFATGYLYAGMGWTTVNEAAVPILSARHTHEELKDMCHKMAADQAEEIRQMRTWLQDWYQVHVDSTMTHGEMAGMNGMASMKRLSALNGREYEIAFMKEMTRHHEMAIKRAKECQTKASHQELIAMCEMIVTNQKREVAQFKEWLCKWYQQCR